MEIIAGRVVMTSHGHQGESRAACALFCDDCHVYDPPGSLHCEACNETTAHVGRLLRAKLQEADRKWEREHGMPTNRSPITSSAVVSVVSHLEIMEFRLARGRGTRPGGCPNRWK